MLSKQIHLDKKKEQRSENMLLHVMFMSYIILQYVYFLTQGKHFLSQAAQCIFGSLVGCIHKNQVKILL